MILVTAEMTLPGPLYQRQQQQHTTEWWGTSMPSVTLLHSACFTSRPHATGTTRPPWPTPSPPSPCLVPSPLDHHTFFIPPPPVLLVPFCSLSLERSPPLLLLPLHSHSLLPASFTAISGERPTRTAASVANCRKGAGSLQKYVQIHNCGRVDIHP